MGKGFRWFVAVVAASVVAAVIQPPIERWLSDVGFVNAPAEIMSWLEYIVGEAAFPWVASGILGLALGVWLDPLLSRLDGRYPMTKKDRAKAIGNEAAWKAAEMNRALGHPFGSGSNFARLFVEGMVVAEKIERLGLPVPEPRSEDGREALAELARYLELTAAPLREGNMKFAKAIANGFGAPIDQ